MKKAVLRYRKPTKTAISASRSLHRFVVRFLKGCDHTGSKDIRVYFNQGRGLHPDKITILHLSPEIARGLSRVLNEWEMTHEGLIWGAKTMAVPLSIPQAGEVVFLIFTDLRGEISECPVCQNKEQMFLHSYGKTPRVQCQRCGYEKIFHPPHGVKAKRHYKVATR